MQFMGKAKVRIYRRFNALVARSMGALLSNVKRNLAITAKNEVIYQRMSYSATKLSNSCL